jgi:hypothetical protein
MTFHGIIQKVLTFCRFLVGKGTPSISIIHEKHAHGKSELSTDYPEELSSVPVATLDFQEK